MSFQEHERYQAHCQYCEKIQEGDSATEAILLVEEHERECSVHKHRLLIEDQINDRVLDLVFCITAPGSTREIVRITPDGQVIVNPEFTTDEAARAFWDAVQKIAAENRGGPQ